MTTPRKDRIDAAHLCTAQDPWDATKGKRGQHPDAVCVYDGGWEQEYERYECPHCKLSFKVELGQ